MSELIGVSIGNRPVISMPALVRPSSLAGLLVSSTTRRQPSISSIRDCHAVVALVVVKAERGVGVDRVEARVLQLVGPQLVGEANAATFLRKIKDDAAAGLLQPRQRQFQLIAAIAPARTEHVAGQASGMDAAPAPVSSGPGADDHRNRILAERIAEHDKARRTPQLSGT